MSDRTLPNVKFTMYEHPLTLATIAAWRDLAARVTCGGPTPITFTVSDTVVAPDGVRTPARLHASMLTGPTPDSTNYVEGKDYALASSVDLRRLGPPSLTQMYKMARMLYCHELMEWFRVDGAPHIDPHPGWAYTLDHPDGTFFERKGQKP